MQRDQSASPLLHYTVTTQPATVKLSTATNPATTDIVVAIAADSNVQCNYLSVIVPVGDAATDMYQTNPVPTAASNSTDWSPSDDNVEGMSAANTANFKTFLFKHQTEDDIVDTPFTITVSGTVNMQAGNATIQIKESSCPADDSDDYSIKQKTQDIAKTADDQFYLNSAVMVYNDTPLVPIAIVERNRAVQLKWQSNGDSFVVYTEAGPTLSFPDKYFDTPTGLTMDSVFIIEATKGEQVQYLQYVAKVYKPDASFGNLTIEEAIINNTSIQNATISSYLNVSASIVHLLSAPMLLAQGILNSSLSFVAPTDGYILIVVNTYPNENNYLDVEGTVTTPNGTFSVSCIPNDGFYNASNSTTVPINNNTVFSLSTLYPMDPATESITVPVFFFWYGFGTKNPIPYSN